MNKAQLIDAVADRLGESKKVAGDAVDAVLETITRNVVNGTKISITGFGSFEKVERPARVARNPRTGERVKVKKSSVPKFRAGQAFKDVVSGEKKLPRATAPAKRTTAAPAARKTTTTAAKKAAPAKKATPTKATAKKAATRPVVKKTAAKAPATRVAAKKATPAKKTTVKATAKKAAPAKKTAKR